MVITFTTTMKNVLQLITILLLLLSCSRENLKNSNADKTALNFNLGISFPPVADQEQREFTAPLLQDLNVAIIRIGEDWRFREPSENNFNWSPLDNRINWAENNGFDVLLTV